MGINALRHACGVTAVAVLLACTAEARNIAAHLEGGFGPTNVRPLDRERAPGVTACAGLSLPFVSFMRADLDLAATAGGDAPGQMFIPEDSRPGDRSLTTLLLGVEVAEGGHSRGPFAFIGGGAGHSTLKNARGVFEPPHEPSRRDCNQRHDRNRCADDSLPVHRLP